MSSVPPQDDSPTLVAAIVFVDLVGYSRKSVADQFAAKEAFRGLLQGVLAPLSPRSPMVLDTGDGAAMAFLSDPEHALYVALEVQEALARREGSGRLGPGDLRVGINLGPVKQMLDLNGRPNLVGEGMNTAERIMSFASPGEVTASRAYGDAICCLRESYRTLFEPVGRRSDKHGREHEVFRVRGSALALQEARSSAGIGAARTAAAAPGPASSPGRKSRAVGWALSMALVMAVALGGWIVGWRADPGKTAASPLNPADVAGSLQEAKPAAAPAMATEPPAPESVAAPALAPGAAPEPAKLSAPRPAKRPPDAAPAQPEAPASLAPAGAGDASRCAALTQRAALGEVLTAKEQEELRNSCR